MSGDHANPTQDKPGFLARLWAQIKRPSKYSLGALILVGGIGGVVFWGGFNTAMEATNTMGFCISCHEMRDNVYAEYRHKIHYQNRTGVKATCSDCHVPKAWWPKMERKIQASNEVFHWLLGSIDTPEKFNAKRLELATHVWEAMKASDSKECRNCHTLESMNPEFQRPRARKVHLDAMQQGNTCIDCHKGIAHTNPASQMPPEQLEALEKPNPKFIREVPETFLAGLKRVEEKEAALSVKAKEKAALEEAAINARIAAAVVDAKAAAGKSAGAAAAPVQAATAAADGPVGGDAALGFDWSGVAALDLTLFYPGQASFEWIQVGTDHGGARAFNKAGERCSACHIKEVRDIGTKISSGQKLEPTPIPNKRPYIDVALKAAHDGKNLFLRFEWQDLPHAPVPFAEGGKMDKDNEIKVAVMIAGTGIERVDQAGCWVTCHSDSRSMADAAKVDAGHPLAKRLAVSDGVTKYLADTRTEVELRNSPRGGWDKLKDEAAVKALADAGGFMDLWRVKSGGKVENGAVTDHRSSDGEGLAGSAKLEGGKWVVEMKRALDTGKPGDAKIEPGKVYTVGFAIHDDFANARFHHVSLDYRLALDGGEAEIIAKKK